MKSKQLNFLGSLEDDFSGLNSYLRLAYLSISIAARPLHASEILSIGRRFGLTPPHLFGRTQIKTLNARLSEYILDNGDDGLFFRTAPAVYYLKHLSQSDDPYKTVEAYNATRRLKTVSEENVLVCPTEKLKESVWGFKNLDEEDFQELFERHSYFMPRKLAEEDTSVKQFVTYTTISNDKSYLVFRRGKYSNPSENLRNTLSIAFGGHVNDEDFGLFSNGFDALVYNSVREMNEEIQISDYFDSFEHANQASEVKGFINVDDNSDARQHVAVVINISVDEKKKPSRHEDGIIDVAWYELEELDESKSYFDLWSRMIVSEVLEGNYAARRNS